MKMFYVIPMCMMFINGFVADATQQNDTVAMNTTDSITSITNTTDSPYSYNVSTSTDAVAIYPTYTINTTNSNKKNYTSTSDTNDINDKMYGSNFIIGSCMLYTLSQL